MNIQNLDVISVNIWGILISLANLVIMYFIVKKFLFRPVQKVMADRGAEVGRVYSDADRALAEAEKSRDEYEAKLAASDEEAGNIIRAAKERANAESRDIISADHLGHSLQIQSGAAEKLLAVIPHRDILIQPVFHRLTIHTPALFDQ